jgi:hypothetical protein
METECIEKQILKNRLKTEGMLETVQELNGWVMVNGERVEELDVPVSPAAKVLVIPELKVGC